MKKRLSSILSLMIQEKLMKMLSVLLVFVFVLCAIPVNAMAVTNGAYIDEGDQNPDNYRLDDELVDGLKAGYRYIKRYNDQYIMPESYLSIKKDNSGIIWGDYQAYEADFRNKIGITQSMSEYEKIAKIFLYVTWADKHFQDGPAGYFANIGVCQDVTALFVDLCGYYNIDAVCLSGGAHAWALVKLYGKWYYCDCQGGKAFLMGANDDYYYDTFANSSKFAHLSITNLDTNGEKGLIDIEEFYEMFPDIENNISPTRYVLPTAKVTLPKVNVSKRETPEGNILTWDPVPGADYYLVFTCKTWIKDFDGVPYCIKNGETISTGNERVKYIHKINMNENGKYEYNPYVTSGGAVFESSDYSRFYYVVACNCNGEMSDAIPLSDNNTMRGTSGKFYDIEGDRVTNYLFDIWCVGSAVYRGDVYTDKYNSEKTTPTSALYRSKFNDKYLLKPNTCYKKQHSFQHIRTMILPSAETKGAVLEECENCLQRRVIYQKADKNKQPSCLHKNQEIMTVAPSCTKTGAHNTICYDCYKKLSTETIPKKAHSYKEYTTPATLKVNGETGEKCTACGAKKNKTVVPMVKTVKLSKTAFVYIGKAQKPSVTVKDEKGKALKLGTDYTVSYPSGYKKVGSYTVTVKLRGKYSGKKMLTFKINPKATALKTVSGKKKSLLVKWKKQTKQVTGYQLQVATNKAFTKNKKTVNVKGAKKASSTVKKLKSKKKYYVRIRTYKTVGGKKYYSKWSKVKTAKTK